MTNEQLGIKTETDKIKKEATQRYNSARLDYDFFSNSFNFLSVQPCSSNHLYGNGKWKKTVVSAIGQDTFSQFCDKYGNKPIDFKIPGFETQYASYFQPGESITIKDNYGLYSNTYKVAAIIDKKYVVVLMPFKGNATGKIINQSRMDGAKKAMDRFSQIIADFEPTTVSNQNIQAHQTTTPSEETHPPELPTPGVVQTNGTNGSDKKQKMQAIILTLIVIGVIGGIIYYQNKKTK